MMQENPRAALAVLALLLLGSSLSACGLTKRESGGTGGQAGAMAGTGSNGGTAGEEGGDDSGSCNLGGYQSFQHISCCGGQVCKGTCVEGTCRCLSMDAGCQGDDVCCVPRPGCMPAVPCVAP